MTILRIIWGYLGISFAIWEKMIIFAMQKLKNKANSVWN